MQLASGILVGCIRHFSIVLEYISWHRPQQERAEPTVVVAIVYMYIYIYIYTYTLSYTIVKTL